MKLDNCNITLATVSKYPSRVCANIRSRNAFVIVKNCITALNYTVPSLNRTIPSLIASATNVLITFYILTQSISNPEIIKFVPRQIILRDRFNVIYLYQI